MERERGSRVDLSAYFNDARVNARGASGDAINPMRGTENRGRETSIVLDDSFERVDATFFVTLIGCASDFSVRLLADTRYVPSEANRQFLCSLERLIAVLAVEPIAGSVEELVADLGMPTYREIRIRSRKDFS